MTNVALERESETEQSGGEDQLSPVPCVEVEADGIDGQAVISCGHFLFLCDTFFILFHLFILFISFVLYTFVCYYNSVHYLIAGQKKAKLYLIL